MGLIRPASTDAAGANALGTCGGTSGVGERDALGNG